MITHSPIIEDTIRNQGGTYRADLRGKANLPSNGFVVGCCQIGKVNLNDAKSRGDMTRLLEYAANNAVLHQPNRYIGTWVDESVCHIDIVEVFESERVAYLECVERSELAYWDIAKSESVYIADKGLPAVA